MATRILKHQSDCACNVVARYILMEGRRLLIRYLHGFLPSVIGEPFRIHQSGRRILLGNLRLLVRGRIHQLYRDYWFRRFPRCAERREHRRLILRRYLDGARRLMIQVNRLAKQSRNTSLEIWNLGTIPNEYLP